MEFPEDIYFLQLHIYIYGYVQAKGCYDCDIDIADNIRVHNTQQA